MNTSAEWAPLLSGIPFSMREEWEKTGIIRRLALHRILDLLKDAEGNAAILSQLQQETLKLKVFSQEEVAQIFSKTLQ